MGRQICTAFRLLPAVVFKPGLRPASMRPIAPDATGRNSQTFAGQAGISLEPAFPASPAAFDATGLLANSERGNLRAFGGRARRLGLRRVRRRRRLGAPAARRRGYVVGGADCGMGAEPLNPLAHLGQLLGGEPLGHIALLGAGVGVGSKSGTTAAASVAVGVGSTTTSGTAAVAVAAVPAPSLPAFAVPAAPIPVLSGFPASLAPDWVATASAKSFAVSATAVALAVGAGFGMMAATCF